MKKFIVLACALFVSLLDLSAQDRRALEDSVIIGGINRSIIDMSLGERTTDEERMSTQWVYAEFAKEIAREHLVAFSDQELREILKYLKSDAYRMLSSRLFLEKFLSNMLTQIQSMLSGGKKFSFVPNDVDYAESISHYLDNEIGKVKPILDNMFGEDGALMSRLKTADISNSERLLFIQKMEDFVESIPDIYMYTMMDYVSKSAVEEIEGFLTSPTAEKHNIYTNKINNIYESLIEDFSKKLLNEDKEKIRDMMSAYASLVSGFPEYFPVLNRPYMELELKKGLYKGQTRDLLPHGKGVMTDKKGVVYSGQFKEGKRHGLLEVTKPGKETELQFWLNDKYRKEIPVGADEKGYLPAVQTFDGQRNGYGRIYDNNTHSAHVGYFVDGQLNGTGEVSFVDHVAKGEFIDGNLVNGEISWEVGDKWLVNKFQGEWGGHVSRGVHTWVSADTSWLSKHVGYFINDTQTGRGYRESFTSVDTTKISGSFLYGKLYGKGSYKNMSVDQESGIRSVSVYNGEFFADCFDGEGTHMISITDIPEGRWTFTRSYVRLPRVEADSLVIVMKGQFENNHFVKGRISMSNGIWMEGDFNEKGLKKGRMLMKYSDGSWYEGECVDGKPHGYGKVCYNDGSIHEGKFENGYFAKTGKSTSADENPENFAPLEKGLYEYDERTYNYSESNAGLTKARLIKPAGAVLMIRVADALEVNCKGVFDGDTLVEGKVVSSEGTWLEGRFEDGVLIKGKGCTMDKYGTRYEGDIVNGYPHGQGKCIYRDGTWFKGKFANGNRMGGTHYTSDGKVIKVYE